MHRQVFWSGGLGDIITLEATMSDDYRKSITRMYWATRSKPQMAPLFTKLPSFPYLTDHVSLWDAYPVGYCFKDLEHAYSESLHQHRLTGPVEDWSIIKRFYKPEPFTYSSFVKYTLASISHLKLPENYVVVSPYSDVQKKVIQEWRRFTDNDWQWLIKYLAKKKMYGVVINVGDDIVPENKWLINLNNKTSLGEALEITKKASEYIGIDSAFSVIAAQTLPADKIIVVSQNAILWSYKHVYYAPKTEFDFITLHLGATEKENLDWREEHASSCPNPSLIHEIKDKE